MNKRTTALEFYRIMESKTPSKNSSHFLQYR
jgi:hypothetical protein